MVTKTLLLFFDSSGVLTSVVIDAMIFLVVAVIAWVLIKNYLKPNSAEQRKDALTLLFQALGGTALLLGVYFTWQQLINSREELKNSRDVLSTTQQTQITERFTRAIEQLGKDDEVTGVRGASASGQSHLAIRLGGIYALEAIARDSKTDHFAVMEVLTAFVRQNSAKEEEQSSQRDIRPEIQAILTVIGRRKLTYGNGEGQRLDLSGTNLSWAMLNHAILDGVNFTSTHFDNAQLKNAQLKETILTDARFTDAILEGAQLQKADLRGAVLRRAKLNGVNFTGADLSAADLSDAEGLTLEQLDSARTDAATLTSLRVIRRP